MGTIRTYTALLVSSTDKGADFLESVLKLQPGLFSDFTRVNNANEARRLLIQSFFDVILINAPLKDELGTELAIELAEKTDSGLLLMVKGECFEQIAYRSELAGVLTIAKPTVAPLAYQAIRLLLATRERLRRLEKRNQSLYEKMEEIRIVNRAKLVLISTLKLTEEQAHHYVEKQSMDMRISKKQAAESIISTYSEN